MKYGFMIAVALLFSLALAAPPARAQAPYPNGYYGQQSRLSPQDQQQFNKFYSKWLDATRKNDQDDIAGNARHLQEIMARYNIPPNVPFDQIATNAAPAPYGAYPNGQYPAGTYPAYPAYGQARLSPDDQRKFDKAYSNWVDATRKNDQDDIAGNARTMQDLMSRYNIPANVPFAAIATNGYAAGPNGAPPYPPNGTYPYAYPYGPQAQRLSPQDQKDFDKDYRNWLDARRKKDMDDVDKNARRMEDIMARYNIPANVPFDQIASQGQPHR